MYLTQEYFLLCHDTFQTLQMKYVVLFLRHTNTVLQTSTLPCILAHPKRKAKGRTKRCVVQRLSLEPTSQISLVVVDF